MMGLAEIRAANASGTRRARRLQKLPIVPTPEQRARLAKGELAAVSFPYLADYMPRGWRMAEDENGNQLEALFVDTTGQGRDGEPALTQEQLARAIAADPEGLAYASIEFGPFQGYVGRFERVPYKPRAGQRVRYIGGPLHDMAGKLGTVQSTRPKKERANVLFDGEGATREVFYSSIAREYKVR